MVLNAPAFRRCSFQPEEAQMPVDARIREQTNLILNNLEGAAAYPAPDQWGEVDDVDYLYREYTVLTRQRDEARVAEALAQILDRAGYGDVPEGEQRQIRREPVSTEIVLLTVPPTPTLVPAILDRLDDDLGPGVARPDHIVYVCPLSCPATEPVEVPQGTVDPVPPPGSDALRG